MVSNPSSVQILSDSIYLLSFAGKLESGNYNLQINSFRDYWNAPTITDTLDFVISNTPQQQELYLSSLEVISAKELNLQFSEAVQKSSSENLSNYLFEPFGKIISATLVNENTIKLELDDEISKRNITGNLYSITALNILSVSGNQMTKGAGNTLAFVLTKDNLDEAFAFPNPFSISKDEVLKFGNLTKETEIEIMDMNGKILKKISDKSADGGSSWDLICTDGKKLGIGTFLYKIYGINSEGNEITYQLKKFAIVP
jgi:hypothetical protein